jgi:hypothetical protein
MDVTVVYESLFGNTRKIAEAIAAGARDAHPSVRVRLLSTRSTPPDGATGPDLLVVGAPTHALRLSTAASRRQGAQPGRRALTIGPDGNPDGPGAREWLGSLPEVKDGHGAAAFDTRLAFPLAGSAAKAIARRLRRQGYRLVAHPEQFIVKGAQGPLRAGEEARAKAWGTELVRREARLRALHPATGGPPTPRRGTPRQAAPSPPP